MSSFKKTNYETNKANILLFLNKYPKIKLYTKIAPRNKKRK